VQESARARAQEARRLRGGVAKEGQLTGYWDAFGLADARDALQALWDHVEACEGQAISEVIEAELGKDPKELFEEWDSTPFAAASLGQVHRARLGDAELAVKVQYPGIQDALASDIKSRHRIRKLAGSALAQGLDEAALYSLREAILGELDYLREAAACDRFREAFQSESSISIPEVRPELSTARVLTMARAPGKPLTEAQSMTQKERDAAAATILRFSWTGPLKLRLVHADPNPGNFLLEAEKVWFLDFGCTLKLEQEQSEAERRLWSTLLHHDIFESAELFRLALVQGGLVPNIRALTRQSYHTWEELVTRPYRENGLFEWTPRYAEDLLRATHNVCGTDLVWLRGPHALLWRARLGTAATLGMLKAKVDAKSILRQVLEDG
jgi:predicted unusual protein kinase regulating ubiquinone biosynthesis (AarF/ABC1/UbiB family)